MLSSLTQSLELDDSETEVMTQRKIWLKNSHCQTNTHHVKIQQIPPADLQTFYLVHSSRYNFCYVVVIVVEFCRLLCDMAYSKQRENSQRSGRKSMRLPRGTTLTHTHIQKIKRKNSLPTRRSINDLRFRVARTRSASFNSA